MTINPNKERVLTYPDWHDEMRSWKGHLTGTSIGKMYGVSANYVGQLLSDNWRAYLLKINLRTRLYRPTFQDALDALATPGCKITFKPVKAKTLIEKAGGRRPSTPEQEPNVGKLREFETASMFRDGKTLKGGLIRCKKCEETATYYNYQGTVSTEHLAKEFSRTGWLVGSNPNQDICPNCRDKRTEKNIYRATEETAKETAMKVFAEPLKSEIEVIKGPVSEAALAKLPVLPGAPAQTTSLKAAPVVVLTEGSKMDRTERRLVFARLNDLYQDEKTGYSGEWTDAKVAADLGVPVSWVTEVRDADFGPELNASILADKSADITEMGTRMERLIVLIDKKMEQLQGLDEKVDAAIKTVEEAIARFEELQKNLLTEDKHMEGLTKQFQEDVKTFQKMFNDFRGETAN